jgi:hypothetical protein
MCSACLPNVDNENMHATAVYIRFPLKRLRVVFFLTGPACPCGSSTLASQPNKLCFVDCIHAWLSVSRGNRIPGPNIWRSHRDFIFSRDRTCLRESRGHPKS